MGQELGCSWDARFWLKLFYMDVVKFLAGVSSSLAWKIPWTEELGRLQFMGSRRVRYDWATSLSLFTFMLWRRKWQPTPVFLPGESQGREPGGLPSMGLHRVGHDWSDLAGAAWLSEHQKMTHSHGSWQETTVPSRLLAISLLKPILCKLLHSDLSVLMI